jgi:phosphopantetheinyl transferase (holo-ACP synthase)
VLSVSVSNRPTSLVEAAGFSGRPAPPPTTWRIAGSTLNRQGAPLCLLHGGAREVQERTGVQRMHVTISHSRCYAVAYAIDEREER